MMATPTSSPLTVLSPLYVFFSKYRYMAWLVRKLREVAPGRAEREGEFLVFLVIS